MKRSFVAIAVVAVVLSIAFSAQAGGPSGSSLSHVARVPLIANDAPQTPTRSYAMGFYVQAPIPDPASTVQLIEKMKNSAEYALIQREVPWTRILGGESMDAIIDDDYAPLIDLVRGSGLKLVLLVDPLDGLDRTAESNESRNNHVTILDPAIRAKHEAWVKLLVARFKPEYIGLASEINTMGAHGDRRIYEQIRDMSNALAPQSRAISPASQVFVSFQVDDAWDLRPFPHVEVDQFAMVEEFDVDAVGLSSYPGFFFSDPSEIPADYYRRFLAVAGGKPLIQVEGGWPSTSVAMDAGTEAKQAAYVRRVLGLLDGVEAQLVVLLLYPDLDIDDPRWPITPELREALRNFGSMGMVHANYTAKPALGVWSGVFGRPMARSSR